MIVTIPGEPVAQGRPRFARAGKFVRTYDPAKSRNWKAMATDFFRQAMPEDAAGLRLMFPSGPVEVEIVAVFSCPKGDHRKVPVGRRPHSKRPDCENVAKAILDAATAAGVWGDDSQVQVLGVVKWIAAQGEAPYVRVEVEAA